MNPVDTARFWMEAGIDPEGFELRAVSERRGVFATKDFQKGDFLLECRGESVTADEAKDLEKKYKAEKKAHHVYCFKSEDSECCLVCTSLACQVYHDTGDRVNCQLVVEVHQNTPHLCLFASKEIRAGTELKLEKPSKGLSKGTWIALGAAVVGGGAAVVAAPLVLTAVGFTSAGIAGGSMAAGMMSSAAIANGGGVAAGSLVAVLQSAGAAGIPAAASAVIGTSAGALTGGLTKFGLWLKGDKTREGTTVSTQKGTTGDRGESSHDKPAERSCDQTGDKKANDDRNRRADMVEQEDCQDVEKGQSNVQDVNPPDRSHDQAGEKSSEEEDGRTMMPDRDRCGDGQGDPKSYMDCRCDRKGAA